MLSRNPSDWAGDLLRVNIDNIDWRRLSFNPSDWAGDLLRANQDNIDWLRLSFNPSDWAGDLLRANPDKIKWPFIASNPCIFTYDYEQMEANNTEFKEELARAVFHPDRMSTLLETYGSIDI
jgi:hypothetical protein